MEKEHPPMADPTTSGFDFQVNRQDYRLVRFVDQPLQVDGGSESVTTNTSSS